MTINNCVNIATVSGTPALTTYNEFVSWTPTISGTTVAGAGTYTTQFGRYTQIGKMIFITAEIVWTAHTGTGNMLLTNLPFTVRNTTTYTPFASVNLINAAFGAGVIDLVCQFTLNTTQAALLGLRTNNTNLATPMDAAATLRICGCYITT